MSVASGETTDRSGRGPRRGANGAKTPPKLSPNGGDATGAQGWNVHLLFCAKMTSWDLCGGEGRVEMPIIITMGEGASNVRH